MPIVVGGTWTPDSNEIGAKKDTYVSVGGVLGDPFSNYGGGELIYIGDGFSGISVGAIQFDLSGHRKFTSLKFKTDLTVWGDNTRTLLVGVLLDITWEELTVTGADNPFNATEFATSSASSPDVFTSFQITGSSKEITVDLSSFLSSTGTMTLLFAQKWTDEGWITFSSKENSYLSAYSNPPRIEFKEEPLPTSDNQGDSDGSASGGFIALLLIIGGWYYYKKRKKSRKIQQNSNNVWTSSSAQPNASMGGDSFCSSCGNSLTLGSEFCSKCGNRISNQ